MSLWNLFETQRYLGDCIGTIYFEQFGLWGGIEQSAVENYHEQMDLRQSEPKFPA